VKVIVSMPFSGEPMFWQCRPSTCTFNPLWANLRTANGHGGEDKIEFVLSSLPDTVDDGAQFKHELGVKLMESKALS